VEVSAGQVVLTDFVSHLRFVQDFWTGARLDGVSLYSVENHLDMTSRWAGRQMDVALSFGYSPTMLLVLAPLALFPAALAFGLFGLLSVLAAWWQTRPRHSRAGWGLAAFFTPLGVGCFMLGQTAVLTGAGLLYLFLKSTGEARPLSGRGLLLTTVVLWALTAKPPLALTAGAALLALRQWRPVALAVALTAVTTVALSPLMGPGWVADYVDLIRTYNLVEADPAYTFGFVPGHMANLRGVLHVDFGLADDVASRLSSLAWFAGLAVLVAAGRGMRLGSGGTWAAALLLFLLFSPHVSSTEVLQLVLLVPFCVPPEGTLGRRGRVLLVAVPLLPLLTPVFTGVRIPLFTLMAASLILAVWISRTADRHQDAAGYAT
jgi:hypothetical protein